jgi:transposase-like protein
VVEQNEDSKFWMGILNELKNRGVKDTLIAAADGLTGFPEAITAVFPEAEVQLCMVHGGRYFPRFTSLSCWTKSKT